MQRTATPTGSSSSVTTVHHAKRGGAVVLTLGLFALGLATLPSTAQAAGTDPCASPTKSVTYSGATASMHGTVTGDTTVGSVTVTDNADDTQTAQWPAVDSSYYYCRATGTAYLKSNGTSAGSWTVDNDGSRNAQFYDSNPGEFLNNITVTYAVGKAPAARRVSLPAYRSGQAFTIRDGIAPDGGAAASVSFGAKTDLPLFGDWNADGDQSPGVYRPGTRTFYLASDKDGQTVTSAFVFGAAEGAVIVGSTNLVRTPDQARSGNDTAVRSYGGAAQLGMLHRRKGPGTTSYGEKDPATFGDLVGQVEIGYASGDADPYDGTEKRFTFNANHKVGLLLFDEVMRFQTARSASAAQDPFLSNATRPTPGVQLLSSNGAVFGAQYINPTFIYRPRYWIDFKGGMVVAQTTADYVDPYRLAVKGSYTNYRGGDSARHDLGLELDAGFEARIPLQYKITLMLGAQGGVLFPGGALANDQGDKMKTPWLAVGRLGLIF